MNERSAEAPVTQGAVARAQAPEGPVAVLDSGAGGLRLMAASARLGIGRPFLYYGDFENAPYGSKPLEVVLRHVDDACDILCARGAVAIALACNTATSAAVARLRERLAIPVIGMEPAVKPAALARPGGRLLVMATELTLRERKFHELLERHSGGCVVEALPCPGLASAVDSGDLVAASACAREIISSRPDPAPVSAIVLGCTHYGFVAPAIAQAAGGRAPLFDGVEGTARRLLELVGPLNRPNEPVSGSPSIDGFDLLLPGAGPSQRDFVDSLLRDLLLYGDPLHDQPVLRVRPADSPTPDR